MSELHKRLKEFIEVVLGEKFNKLQSSKELKVSESTVHGYLKRKKISSRFIGYLVKHHHLNPNWFFTGKGDPILTKDAFIDREDYNKLLTENGRLKIQVDLLKENYGKIDVLLEKCDKIIEALRKKGGI